MEFYEFYKKNTSIFLRRDWDQTIQLSNIHKSQEIFCLDFELAISHTEINIVIYH